MKAILSRVSDVERTHVSSIGYTYALIGNICMSIMQICVKNLSLYMSTSELLMYRAFFLTIVNTTIIILSGHEVYIKKPRGMLFMMKCGESFA